MHRLSGQDASFLYTETPTVLMHTLKIQIFESPYDPADYEFLRESLEATLNVVPMLRQRVMFVPFNLHHPVLVDDPDFDLDSHVYRTALPAPGDDRELDRMIAQIMCHRLDRQRPLWELWLISGLEGGKVALVHKIHHCLADGAATVRYLSRVFDNLDNPASSVRRKWVPRPLPSSRKLVWDALADHFKHGIRRLPGFLAMMWRSTRRLLSFNREVGSPTISMLSSDKPPRTRLNYTLSARRSFSRRQLPLDEVKAVGKGLGGSINDVVLALAATTIRNYLIAHQDLPAKPLVTSIPVSADAPGAQRELGNRVTYLPTRLWTNIEDPLERFRAIQQSTRLGNEELQVLGRDTFVELMEFLPPAFSLWKTRRKQRLRVADRPDYQPMTNVIVSNVPGPRDKVSGNYGTLLDLYSMGPLVEGCGLNITVWSYAGKLNFSLMGCRKAIPDIDVLADGLVRAHQELQRVAAGQPEEPEQQES